MEIRRIKREEMLDAFKVRTIAFSFRDYSEEEKKRQIAEMSEERLRVEWGCFTDDGKLTAAVRNNRFTAWYDGNIVRMGGIGGVASLPEHRYGGAIKSIMRALLTSAREEGETLSALYPFSHEFYRKFGYEMCLPEHEYEFPATLIADYKHKGWARRMEEGDSIEPLREIYRAFAAKYNLMVDRADDKYFIGEPYVAHQATMLLGDERGARAYLYYGDEFMDDGKRLRVHDCAFLDANGFQMILGFLSRMSAGYRSICMQLPEDIPLGAMAPRPYELQKRTRYRVMARVTHVGRALTMLKRPVGSTFTIRVTDDFLPENTGVYQVSDAGAVRTEESADLEVSVQALALLAVGTLDLDGALFRRDVRLNANADTLRRVFVRKPAYIAEDF